MEGKGNTIKLNMAIEIPIDEIGETLVCDDSESYPLCGYGYIVQEELYKMLGWTKKVSDKFYAEAIEEIDNEECEKVIKSELEYDTYIQRWIEKVQQWAEDKLEKLKCDTKNEE